MFPLRDDNPTRYPPVVTIGIIIINALVFLWQFAGDPLENQRRLFQFAAVPFNLTHSNEEAALVFARTRLGIDVEYAAVERGTRTSARLVTQTVPSSFTLLTSMFMHGGLWHILGNMWFLWIFGNNIEDALGRVRFVLFYLLTGLAAHAGHILSNKDSLMPTVGASGAISGVLGAYLVLYPRARVLTLIPFGYFLQTVLLPAMVFLPIWFAMQLLPALAGSEAGVAWWAHIGGFAAGLALVKVFETQEHRGRSQRTRLARAGQPWFDHYRGLPPRRGGF